MLAKKYRLALAQAKKEKPVSQKRNPFFLIKVFKAKDGDGGKLGVVISKKVHPLASHRNILKRGIFEFFRENRKDFDLSKNYIIIPSVNAGEIIKENSVIVRHLKELFYDRK